MNALAPILQALCGLCSFVVLAWCVSEQPSAVRWRAVGLALMAQAGLALATMHVGIVRSAFMVLSRGIGQIKLATQAGTSFVFGYVGGADLPFSPVAGANTFVFALQALPTVMVVSALAMLGFHLRILPTLVRGSSWILSRTLNIGGALGVCAAAKVFLGQTEAPLLIRPYIGKLTRSELFTVMTLGMATTSASVMVIYATILQGTLADPISHILTASIISVPAAVAISRLMVPQTGPDTEGDVISPYNFTGAMEAVANGATDGMKLFLNIIAMLIVMLALVFLSNAVLAVLPWQWVGLGDTTMSLQQILGWVMAPVAWLMGVPWAEAQVAGKLLGVKLALNEVMAFIELSRVADAQLSGTTRLIMLYALCGFANFASIG
ncbi:MAG: nucleoside:proton symporter, partial [Deltaproteobacteria bacterium]